jgi:hypothetical protein
MQQMGAISLCRHNNSESFNEFQLLATTMTMQQAAARSVTVAGDGPVSLQILIAST